MKRIDIITVGKLKEKGLRELEEALLSRLNRWSLSIYEEKSSGDEPDKEGKRVVERLQKIQTSRSQIFLLDENAQQMTTQKFTEKINDCLERLDQIIFIFGGATGHASCVKELPAQKLSLSPMTTAHQIARVFLIEQIYRAHCLVSGHPYHK